MVAVLIARCGHTRCNLVFLVVRVSVVHVHTLVLSALAAAKQSKSQHKVHKIGVVWETGIQKFSDFISSKLMMRSKWTQFDLPGRLPTSSLK